MSELREKVAAAISDVEYPRLVPKREHYAMADAAIALIRNETLEEAARVVALMPRTYDKIKQDHDVLGMKGTWTFTLNNGPAECAAAIRALKDRT